MVMAYGTIPGGEPQPSCSTKPDPLPFAEKRYRFSPQNPGFIF